MISSCYPSISSFPLQFQILTQMPSWGSACRLPSPCIRLHTVSTSIHPSSLPSRLILITFPLNSFLQHRLSPSWSMSTPITPGIKPVPPFYTSPLCCSCLQPLSFPSRPAQASQLPNSCPSPKAAAHLEGFPPTPVLLPGLGPSHCSSGVVVPTPTRQVPTFRRTSREMQHAGSD